MQSLPVRTEEVYFVVGQSSFKCPALTEMCAQVSSWLLDVVQPPCALECFSCYLRMGAIVDCDTVLLFKHKGFRVGTPQSKQDQWFQFFNPFMAVQHARFNESALEAGLGFDKCKSNQMNVLYLAAMVNACVEVPFFCCFVWNVAFLFWRMLKSSAAAAVMVWASADVCNKFSDLILSLSLMFVCF